MNKAGEMPKKPADLKVQIFADGADLKVITELSKNPLVKGFTTNPSLMRKAGVSDYRAFALEAIRIVGDRSISLEVFSDELAEIEKQAMEITSWGKNVYVKIPVTNTRGEFTGPLVRRLAQAGVQLNITAILTLPQVEEVVASLSPKTSSFVSVFAGRVADTGRDPMPLMADSVKALKANPKAELIWASTRELLNIYQADAVGCHIITVTNDVLAKLSTVGKDLSDYSLDTVKLFYRDATSAGFRIATR